MKVLSMFLVLLTIIFNASAEKTDSPPESRPDSNSKNSANSFDLDISIGASFNFLDNIVPNSIYGDLFFEWIDMWTTDTKVNFFNDRICGLTVGMNNGRIVDTDSGDGDSKEEITTDIFRTNLTFNGQISKKSKTLFLIGYLEARKKFINSSINPKKEFWNSAFGGGFMFFTDQKKIGKVKVELIAGREFEFGGDEWYPIGIGRFEFISDPYDVKIGITVRGQIRKQTNYVPEMLIYLSKVFKVEKLLGFLGDSA